MTANHWLWCENCAVSCDLDVFVDRTAGPVPPQQVDIGGHGWWIRHPWAVHGDPQMITSPRPPMTAAGPPAANPLALLLRPRLRHQLHRQLDVNGCVPELNRRVVP